MKGEKLYAEHFTFDVLRIPLVLWGDINTSLWTRDNKDAVVLMLMDPGEN
jgi:hypothetical protein